MASDNTQAFLAALDRQLKNYASRLDSVEKDTARVVKLTNDSKPIVNVDLDKIYKAVQSGVAVINQKASEQARETSKKISSEVKSSEDSFNKKIDASVASAIAEFKQTYNLNEFKDALRSLDSSDELESIVDALTNIKLEVPDTSPSLTGIASAIENLDVTLDLSGIEKALEENTKAIYFLMKQTETITSELQDLSDIVKADKVVEYDEKGRIKKVSVVVGGSN